MLQRVEYTTFRCVMYYCFINVYERVQDAFFLRLLCSRKKKPKNVIGGVLNALNYTRFALGSERNMYSESHDRFGRIERKKPITLFIRFAILIILQVLPILDTIYYRIRYFLFVSCYILPFHAKIPLVYLYCDEMHRCNCGLQQK